MRIAIASLMVIAALLCARATAAGLTDNTAVTYIGSDGTRRIHNFSNSPAGLVENHFNGATWQWNHHPVPSDKYGSHHPVALTWEEDGTQRIYVFAIAGNGHRFVARYFNGTQWDWALLPTASFLKLVKFVAFTYVDELGKRRIELFGIDDPATFNNLVRTWWDGSAWHSTKSRPLEQGWLGSPVAVTYDEKGVQRIEVFCTVKPYEAAEASLYSYSWQRGTWRWKSLGLQDFSPGSAITYKDAGDPRHIQLFGHGVDSSLAVYDWDGTSWSLLDLGKPEAQSGNEIDLSAVTYMSQSGHRQTFFATTYNDHLYFRRRNGTSWSSYASFPNGTTQFANDPAWIFNPDPRSGGDVLQMFVSSADGLMRHRWNGTNWQSFGQGTP
jgi:hypothetical protein